MVAFFTPSVLFPLNAFGVEADYAVPVKNYDGKSRYAGANKRQWQPEWEKYIRQPHWAF
ncbi:MAG: hypothetical protein LBS77_05385 [Desulfovibrio sp.]|nr:hypothetical protein [Desulfovibrio sp.]